MKPEINFLDFEKLDIRIGKIVEVEEHPNADKLYVLKVDFSDFQRTILAGLKPMVPKESLLNKKCPFIINLAPREIRGITSEGMILAVVPEDKSQITILNPLEDIPRGSKVS
jgi:methionyl-tRNA synthetase